MNRRFVTEIVCGAVLFTAGLGCGCLYANRDLGIRGELRNVRKKLNAHYTGPQSEMTTVSEFQLNLAQMELYHVRYMIWNQANYIKIESDFQKDEQRWEAEFKKEQKKPSEFEGGSMAPMDHNMRMTAFIEKRITELQTKWLDNND